jgi:hypothetical protein
MANGLNFQNIIPAQAGQQIPIGPPPPEPTLAERTGLMDFFKSQTGVKGKQHEALLSAFPYLVRYGAIRPLAEGQKPIGPTVNIFNRKWELKESPPAVKPTYTTKQLNEKIGRIARWADATLIGTKIKRGKPLDYVNQAITEFGENWESIPEVGDRVKSIFRRVAKAKGWDYDTKFGPYLRGGKQDIGGATYDPEYEAAIDAILLSDPTLSRLEAENMLEEAARTEGF